jgi:hypothetical protein
VKVAVDNSSRLFHLCVNLPVHAKTPTGGEIWELSSETWSSGVIQK